MAYKKCVICGKDFYAWRDRVYHDRPVNVCGKECRKVRRMMTQRERRDRQRAGK